MRQILLMIGGILVGYSLKHEPLTIALGLGGVVLLLIAGYMDR